MASAPEFTPEFLNTVSEKNLLRLRIMLKDSLLVDKSFNQFKEMSTYAKNKGVDFWMQNSEKLEIPSKQEWSVELMNLELTRLVNDFTPERLKFCQDIIEKIYGKSVRPAQSYTQQSNYTSAKTTSSPKTMSYSNTSSASQNRQQSSRPVSLNTEDYTTILRTIKNVNTILEKNKTQDGAITWKYEDIDNIHENARKLCTACKNIKNRRK